MNIFKRIEKFIVDIIPESREDLNDISIGDRVRLGTEGPMMIVEYRDYRIDICRVLCTWFDVEGNNHSQWFNSEILNKVN